jgi:hypothetical protein
LLSHILRRNCLIKHVIEGRVEGTGRRGRRSKQLLDDLDEMIRWWKMKVEALSQMSGISLWKRIWSCCYDRLRDVFSYGIFDTLMLTAAGSGMLLANGVSLLRRNMRTRASIVATFTLL